MASIEIKNIKLNTTTNKLHADLCVDGQVSISATLDYIQEQLRTNTRFSTQVPRVQSARAMAPRVPAPKR